MADFRAELEARREALQKELDALNLVLGERLTPNKARRVGRPPKDRSDSGSSSAPQRKRRKMSAAARKRLSESAKRRWVAAKRAGKSTL
jgi:hypothetical protein